MRGSGDVSLDWKGTAVTLLVLGAVILTGVVVLDTAATESMTFGKASNGESAFSQYCYERFGEDAYLIVSNTIGTHGGLHCYPRPMQGPGIHYQQIPQGTLQKYTRGEITAQQVTQSIEPLPPWYQPYLEVLPATLLVGCIILAITYLAGRVRNYKEA